MLSAQCCYLAPVLTKVVKHFLTTFSNFETTLSIKWNSATMYRHSHLLVNELYCNTIHTGSKTRDGWVFCCVGIEMKLSTNNYWCFICLPYFCVQQNLRWLKTIERIHNNSCVTYNTRIVAYCAIGLGICHWQPCCTLHRKCRFHYLVRFRLEGILYLYINIIFYIKMK